jgi:hypothetical protein
MDYIAEMNTVEEEKQDPGYLFKQLMASINPFGSYVIDECKTEDVGKEWALEESLF